jgi:sulfide:quinone oxidoreductase
MAIRVLIAGGGVAALEAALALGALAEERASVELLAPEPDFWYRPLAVAEPFGLGEARHFELSALASAAGAIFTPGSLLGIDADAHTAQTSVGAVPYDVLLVACGAVPSPAVRGALTFRGPADSDKLRDLVTDIKAGTVTRVVFVVPGGAVWSLPIYELALMTAAHAEALQLGRLEITVATPEEQPLQLFGRAASDALSALLDERGIAFQSGSYATEFSDGELRIVPEGRIAADRVVALPRLRGPQLDGVPQTLDRFIPVEPDGRVAGFADVFAAGDITGFPVKQGGLATQQADAAAEAIAASAGADITPQPFRPVLRGLLLTGSRPRYIRHGLAFGPNTTISPEPLWWPPAKIVGRYLAPFLAAVVGVESPADAPMPPGALAVDTELDGGLDSRSVRYLPLEVDSEGRSVRDVMWGEPLVVAPEDTLGEIAEEMRRRDVGSAVVADYGRVIGT